MTHGTQEASVQLSYSIFRDTFSAELPVLTRKIDRPQLTETQLKDESAASESPDGSGPSEDLKIDRANAFQTQQLSSPLFGHTPSILTSVPIPSVVVAVFHESHRMTGAALIQ